MVWPLIAAIAGGVMGGKKEAEASRQAAVAQAGQVELSDPYTEEEEDEDEPLYQAPVIDPYQSIENSEEHDFTRSMDQYERSLEAARQQNQPRPPPAPPPVRPPPKAEAPVPTYEERWAQNDDEILKGWGV